ncbi:MAG: hypothetical protein JRC93_01790 [Deltaproteobacteria bacterium]|nr:hypothetical protein [Deltaproteobacteria bacterium]
MFGAKSLARKMIQGVDVVKLVLYKILTDEFSEKYQNNGEEFYKTLAAALINEIFCCHNEMSRSVFDENKNTVIDEIKNLGTNHPELKRPITDALRASVQANFMLSGKMQDNFEEVFNNAIERDIFIKGGEKPEPKTFLEMTEKLIQKYNIK